MALTENRDVPLGTPCPEFRLPRVDGGEFGLADAAGAPVLVVMFICNHCPYVQAIEDRLVAFAREYEPRGVCVVGICSNDPTDYPDDRPERLLARWRERGYGFPYLLDTTQEVARAYGAVCTPDFFGYNKDLELQYRGRLDASKTTPVPGAIRELYEAMVQVAETGRGPEEQIPSMGCSIKWKTAA